MEYKKIALVGAGAIGAYFIHGLAGREDLTLTVVAEGERAQRLRTDGLSINGRHFDLNVASPEEAHDPDLLLVCTKYTGLFDALDEIGRTAGPDTTVMSLMNGIDSEEVISRVVPAQQILYAMIRLSSERKGNEIHFRDDATFGVFFGEKDTADKTPRCAAFEEFMEGTPMRARFTPDIIHMQWQKYALNISFNLPQAILSVGYASYFDSVHAAFLKDALFGEVQKVAAAEGITLTVPPDDRNTCRPQARFSTLQDLDAKRHTEVDMFLGVLIERARRCGIVVPYSEFAYHEIKALEEKNDGLFDY